MKQLNNMLLAAALLSVSLNAAGQKAKKDTTLNRVVVVEKEYNPDIMDASKVNVLPKVQEPFVGKRTIEYNMSLLPISSLEEMMNPVTRNLDQAKAKRGFAQLGYGNYGNLDARAAYLFDLSPRDQLNVSGSLEGMNASLKLPEIFESAYQNRNWKSRYYRTKLNADYQHRFDRVLLDAAVNFGTDNFNYHAFLEPENALMPSLTDKQHHAKWSLHAGIKSLDKNFPLQFQAETNFLSFKKSYPESVTEKIWRNKGDVYGMIGEQQRVGIKAEMNNFFYSKTGYRSYTSLELNPYYVFSNDSWKVRLGAHVDYSSLNNNVDGGKSSPAIQVSPDIETQYLFAKSYVAYLKLVGGRELNDFRRLESLNPYANFYQQNNSYNQLDAMLGFKANVGGGFWFDLFAGYNIINDDLCFSNLFSNMINLAKPYTETEDTKHFYIGSKLKYTYRGVADFSLKGTYYSWKNSDMNYMLMKPKFDLQFNADVKVLPKLTINAGYRYIARSEVNLNYIDVVASDYINPTLSGSGLSDSFISPVVRGSAVKLSPVSDLSLGATYNLSDDISIFARFSNIMNKDYQYYYSYPVQGINFLAGASIRF